MSAQTRSEIAELLRRHGLTPSHHLGQHFLADANITRKIVAVSGVGPGSSVVEVGSGTGSLTKALAASGARVIAFEVDPRLEPVLAETLAGFDVTLHYSDAMNVDLPGLLGRGPWVMVANLPYNVGTPLLLDLLRGAPEITRFVVMVQREVAERLVAGPGTGAYGLPSVVVSLYGRGRLAFRVPPQVFIPPPRVESAVVVIDRVATPAGAARAVELAGAAFGQRRKMLRGSLQSVVGDPVVLLEAAGIDPTRRAEELSADDYLRLASA